MPSRRSKASRKTEPRPKPTAKLVIVQYLHCRKCLVEIREIVQQTGDSQSPALYSRYDVGFTGPGLQMWCRRHNLNIVHIDFEGQQHPANSAGE